MDIAGCYLAMKGLYICGNVQPRSRHPFCRPVSPERVHWTLLPLRAESLPSQSCIRIPWMALANQSQGSTERISDSGGTKFTGVSDMDFPESTLGRPLVCSRHGLNTEALPEEPVICGYSLRERALHWLLSKTCLWKIKDCLRPAFYFKFSIRNIISYAAQGLEEFSVQYIT